ncbi:YcaO-like family protein [Candidatus Enterovibrio escicola]|uniref:YcaO-like family protein n=1 Tax=Candidatus Enterovibrio escicola TaxID=1927127 RepID=UPI0012380D5B|nr:YcaO-like family protein [Candidatus Enterovibrio escacola]
MFYPNLKSQAFLDKLSKVCSNKLGITPSAEKLKFENGLYITRCHSNSGISLLTGRKNDIVSCGNDASLNLSAVKVAAEYFERYCWYSLSIYRGKAPKSWEQMINEGNFASPPNEIINAFSENQYSEPTFPLKKLGPREPIYWLKTTDLDNQSTYLPAQIFVPQKPEEVKYWSPNSNGVAFHIEKDEAFLNSLLELVERDAFLHVWWAKLSPAVISQEDNRFVLDITGRIGVPCVAVVEIYRQHILIGTSADFNKNKAIDKASSEVEQLKIVSALHDNTENVEETSGITSFEDSLNYYKEENLHLTNFLTQGVSATKEMRAGISTLSELINRLKELNIRIYTADLTTPEVAAMGEIVLKSYSPDLISLNHDDRCRPLAAIKRITGCCAAEREPHPFL